MKVVGPFLEASHSASYMYNLIAPPARKDIAPASVCLYSSLPVGPEPTLNVSMHVKSHPFALDAKASSNRMTS